MKILWTLIVFTLGFTSLAADNVTIMLDPYASIVVTGEYQNVGNGLTSQFGDTKGHELGARLGLEFNSFGLGVDVEYGNYIIKRQSVNDSDTEVDTNNLGAFVSLKLFDDLRFMGTYYWDTYAHTSAEGFADTGYKLSIARLFSKKVYVSLEYKDLQNKNLYGTYQQVDMTIWTLSISMPFGMSL